MATNRTQTFAAWHEVGHAVLSLVGSIAVANLPITDATTTIHALTGRWEANDVDAMRRHVEKILREQSGQPNMENVVRHCHELRQKCRAYQRLTAEG